MSEPLHADDDYHSVWPSTNLSQHLASDFDTPHLFVERHLSITTMANSRAPHVSQLSTELPGVKHYITGHNEEGKAIVASEREAQWKAFDDKTMAFNQVYTTNFPAQLADQADINAHDDLMKAGTLGLVKKSGVVCRMVRCSVARNLWTTTAAFALAFPLTSGVLSG